MAVLRKFKDWEAEGEIGFDELNGDLQRRLLKAVLEDVYGLSSHRLSGILREIRPPKRVDPYVAFPTISTQVLGGGEKFYLALEISCEIRSAKTLWDLAERIP